MHFFARFVESISVSPLIHTKSCKSYINAIEWLQLIRLFVPFPSRTAVSQVTEIAEIGHGGIFRQT